MTASQLPAAGLLDRLTELAGEFPDRPAFVVADPDGGETVFTFAELVADAHRFTARFRTLDIGPGDVVVLAPQNHPAYLSMVFGAWWAGAAVLPISPSFSAADRGLLLDVVTERLGRAVLVDTTPHDRYATLDPDAGLIPRGELPAARRPGEPGPYLFMTSGGTTGLPKIMPMPLRWVGGERSPYGQAGLAKPESATGTRTRLICGSLHHAGNFTVGVHVLLTGSAVLILRRFEAALAVDLLRRYEVYSLGLAPYYMMLILGLPGLDPTVFDGLSRITHGAAPCPQWVKRAWIDMVGPDRIFEVYYSSELGGSGRPMVAGGNEWLKKPGTVGKAENVRILDEHGADVLPGTVGEIYFAQTFGQAHAYVGDSKLRHAPDDPSYVSVADVGWLDPDGYLFLADRMSEVLEIGGSTVYPSRVEEVIGEHPLVGDVAVVGLTDEQGRPYVHALVEPAQRSGLDAAEVRDWCAGRLPEAERPSVVQLTEKLPRTAEGKMRRSVVREMAKDTEA